ncbi:MAG: hypothetical protein QOJ42_3393 [Acidobacteriaceae bacterium]|jgi:hypothetical protein|nr:hypothetical protein [Acidobacteriaceae bacterium]
MPNWMESEVQITGPVDEIARFRVTHIRQDEHGDEELDFETIIPMPPELKDTEAGSSDPYVWALGGELYASRNLLLQLGLRPAGATPLDWRWVRDLGITSREGLLHWAKENRPNELVVAKRAMDSERATGYRDWYDWRCDNWGCKWGCSEFAWRNDDQTAFYMMTPWSAPVPIFEKLVELFPTLTFACRFVEEGMAIDERETYYAA